MAARDLLVRVLGDTRDVEAAFARSNRAATQFGASVETTGKRADKAARNLTSFAKGTAAGFGGAIAIQALVSGIGKSVTAASDLNEQIAKSREVFGASSQAIESWSRETASSLGIARNEALAAAGTFGNLFRSVGIQGSEAAGLSRQFVQLAADLASFNNASPEDTLAAIRSGLIGEAEPLRRYGVLLSEARVQQLALAQTGKESTKELTAQEKLLARVNLIMRDTTIAQGDVARTSGSFANQSRILRAQLSDLEANIGGALLPALTNLVTGLNDAARAAGNLNRAINEIGARDTPVPGTGVSGRDIDRFFESGFAEFLAGLGLPGLVRETDTRKAVNDFAKAFDDQFDSFTEGLEKATDKSTKRANAKLKAFGQEGFKLIDVNELGEALQRQYDSTVAALQLQFDKAQVTTLAADDLSVLAELEKVIQARIKTHGRTTELMRELFQVQQQRAGVLEGLRQQQEQAKQAQIDKVLGQLGFAVDRSQLTSQLSDDLAALKALAAGLRAQVARGGDVLDYQRQLVTVTGQIADVQREIAENSARVAQQRQFRALGLSASGGDVIPGVENLRKQLEQLTKRLGPDLTGKMRSQLSGVAKVLRGQFGSVTEESREAIRDLFKTIRDTFDKESGKDIAPRRVQISDKILTALGFDQDAEVKAFRATQQLTRTPTFPTGAKPIQVGTTTATGGGVTITGPVTVVADDPDAFLRELQKKAGRTTATSRGRFPGRSLGLG